MAKDMIKLKVLRGEFILDHLRGTLIAITCILVRARQRDTLMEKLM